MRPGKRAAARHPAGRPPEGSGTRRHPVGAHGRQTRAAQERRVGPGRQRSGLYKNAIISSFDRQNHHFCCTICEASRHQRSGRETLCNRGRRYCTLEASASTTPPDMGTFPASHRPYLALVAHPSHDTMFADVPLRFPRPHSSSVRNLSRPHGPSQ